MVDTPQAGQGNVPAAQFIQKPRHPAWQFWHLHVHHTTSRGISIVSALLLDIVLIVLFWPMHDYEPATQFTEEVFWVFFFSLLVVYTVVQYSTLMKQTGTGQEFAAGIDKIAAMSPALLFIVAIAWWAGGVWFAHVPFGLLWRQCFIGGMLLIWGFTDYFGTDIVNMRLRSLQMPLRPAGT